MNSLPIEDDFDLEEDMEELSSAEDFLVYFNIPFDEKIVNVNRLHILQRYHDYLNGTELPELPDARAEMYKFYLTKAYNDFVESDAKTEKVLDIYKRLEPQDTFVKLEDIFK
jgi:nitrogenase-stabilizing/protective protein